MGHTWLELMREPRLETHVAVIETACKAMASSEIDLDIPEVIKRNIHVVKWDLAEEKGEHSQRGGQGQGLGELGGQGRAFRF